MKRLTKWAPEGLLENVSQQPSIPVARDICLIVGKKMSAPSSADSKRVCATSQLRNRIAHTANCKLRIA
jgi:hypothetical protein